VRIVRAGGVLETERLGLRVEIDALYDEIES